MKPALSVIFLTTLIGAGQGLFLAYYSVDVLSLLAVLPSGTRQPDSAVLAGAMSIALLIAGLLASFFHLGHPERAWRAAAMWRTSWLSREVIALPLATGLIFLYTLLKYVENHDEVFILANGIPVELSTFTGFFAMLAVMGLFLCTAMIYTCLKFLRQWHNPLTVVNFFLLGTASGFTLAATIATRFDPQLFGFFAGGAIFFSLLGLVSRYISLLRNKKLRSPTTLQSAIGIHHPTIRQLAQGAMGGSFNTRAFIHTYGATVVILARRFFLFAGFVIPIILLIASDETSITLCSLAFLAQYAGLMVERWYFFIEAEHPQNVYYQMIS